MLTANLKKENKHGKKMELDLSAIVQHKFSEREYVKERHTKKMIVLHHTVSGEGVNGDINWWLKDKIRVCTCILISRPGVIHQLFNSKYFGYHLGEKPQHFKKFGLMYKRHDQMSIGIEIDSWGGLVKHVNDLWYPAKWNKATKRFEPNLRCNHIPIENVQEYPNGYRGFYGFEKYTQGQIQRVRELILHWHKKYGIPVDYKENMFEHNADAMKGTPGVWSHTSFRPDKSDVHPQPELISMLKSLENEV